MLDNYTMIELVKDGVVSVVPLATIRGYRTLGQVAEKLGVCRTMVINLERKYGIVPTRDRNGARLFSPEEVEVMAQGRVVREERAKERAKKVKEKPATTVAMLMRKGMIGKG